MSTKKGRNPRQEAAPPALKKVRKLPGLIFEKVRKKCAKVRKKRNGLKHFETFHRFGLIIGGAQGDRTPDLKIANLALSQLS